MRNLLLALLLFTISVRGWAATTSYHVGNSLTWDSQPLAFEEYANANGETHDVGLHIRCSSSLADIWNNPNGTCIDPEEQYGKFSEALPGFEWTQVTLQPHPVSDATLGEDTEMLGNFISLTQQNPENADTIFWIYSAWPRRDQEYQSYWTQSSGTSPDADAKSTRAYVHSLIEEVRADNLSTTIKMVPVGEVWYELDIRMRAGWIPGFTNIDELYRDVTHASTVGRFVSGITHLAALFGNDLSDLELVSDTYFNVESYDTGLVPALLDAIHDVVFTHPFTELSLATLAGDYDRNGLIDLDDFEYWKVHYGTTVAQPGAGADGNFDGRISAADFTVWRDRRCSSLGSAAMSVPEPQAWVYLVPLVALIRRWNEG